VVDQTPDIFEGTLCIIVFIVVISRIIISAAAAVRLIAVGIIIFVAGSDLPPKYGPGAMLVNQSL